VNVGPLLVDAGAWALSYTLVGVVRRIAINQNLMDLPNERSSHVVATPRGGGVGIVFSFVAAISVLWALNLVPGRFWLALVLSSSAIALVGFLDDRHQLRASIRLLVHLGAAILFVAVSGGYSANDLLEWGMRTTWAASAFSVVALVWGTNLFNFMDGIDGIAAVESIFITAGGGVLNLISGGDPGLTAVLFSLSAASLGFLFWNWPPARIFMGDVGSGFLGFVVSACLMAASRRSALPVEVLPILGGIFFVDATTTLIRRIVQGDRWFEPHRTHAYQWMTRRFGAHLPVTLIVTITNVVWLLPWAIVATRFPGNGRLYMAAALLPLVIVAIIVGAGRRETKTSR
jgi:Fuc2NAc and GlcNAc transferase